MVWRVGETVGNGEYGVHVVDRQRGTCGSHLNDEEDASLASSIWQNIAQQRLQQANKERRRAEDALSPENLSIMNVLISSLDVLDCGIIQSLTEFCEQQD